MATTVSGGTTSIPHLGNAFHIWLKRACLLAFGNHDLRMPFSVGLAEARIQLACVLLVPPRSTEIDFDVELFDRAAGAAAAAQADSEV